MRRLFVALIVASAVWFALLPIAHAQSPPPATETVAPITSPGAVVEDTAEEDDDGRPWWRLAVFVPVSAALGAAVVFGRRAARDRGWVRS